MVVAQDVIQAFIRAIETLPKRKSDKGGKISAEQVTGVGRNARKKLTMPRKSSAAPVVTTGYEFQVMSCWGLKANRAV